MLKQILEKLQKNEGKDPYEELVDLLDNLQYGKMGKKGEAIYQEWINDNYYDTSDYTGHDSDDEIEWLSSQDDSWYQEQLDFLKNEV
jgi:hypothetical protein